MTSMFDSYQLGGLRLPNRIVMAPMTRARATADGLTTPAIATYYAQRATAGLIVSEGVAPNERGQSNVKAPGLYTDEQVAAWRPVTDAVHTNGGRIFAQIMHGGRVGHEAVQGHQPVGPSAIALDGQVYAGTALGFQPAPVPYALSTREAAAEARVYGEAARRAVEAGFDGVELHGANGYLIQQFLSSGANHRTDVYGGSITGRIRFAVEAVEAAADAIGADRVGLRISPGGTVWDTVEEDVPQLYGALAEALAPLGLAYLHTLVTTDDDTLIGLRKAWPGTFLVNPSEQIGPVEATREGGEEWLAKGADLISYGRKYLANPDLVERFRTGAPLAPTPEHMTFYQDDTAFISYPSAQYA
ncbi:N-ethylmaleimide reductase [Streptomyces sp. enrichment culture]|uniref:alkene reductase n=1 Tax=Streptomyces xiamenensis TaxID=408015 RepID=UPI0036E9600A